MSRDNVEKYSKISSSPFVPLVEKEKFMKERKREKIEIITLVKIKHHTMRRQKKKKEKKKKKKKKRLKGWIR